MIFVEESLLFALVIDENHLLNKDFKIVTLCLNNAKKKAQKRQITLSSVAYYLCILCNYILH